jgi:hypothetical protein
MHAILFLSTFDATNDKVIVFLSVLIASVLVSFLLNTALRKKTYL